MHGKRHGIDVDKTAYMRNTIQLGRGSPGVGGHPSRFGFFSCYFCNWSQGDRSGVLLQANLTHHCRCGKPLLLLITR